MDMVKLESDLTAAFIEEGNTWIKEHGDEYATRADALQAVLDALCDGAYLLDFFSRKNCSADEDYEPGLNDEDDLIEAAKAGAGNTAYDYFAELKAEAEIAVDARA